jgi:ADP-heptose:LPS heptosyltransferase
MINNPGKILIVKLCCIGDIIFSIPLLKTLKMNLPQSKITFLVSDWCKDLVENIKEVDSVVLFNAPFKKKLFKKIYGLINLIFLLRSKKFDAVINLHRNKFFGLIFFLSGIKTRIGYGNSFFYSQKEIFHEDLPEPERILELLKGFSFQKIVNDLELSIDDVKIPTVKVNLKRQGVDFSKKIIAIFADGGINPGTSMDIKQLRVFRYIELISKVRNFENIQIVLLVPKEKESNASKIYSAIENKERLVSLSGLSILELMVLFKNCLIVVGADTGLLHLAAACGSSVIMLFGPSNPMLVAPKGDKHKIIWHKIECAPCYTPSSVQDKRNFKNGSFFCKRGDVLCMELITIEEILEGINDLYTKAVSDIKE